MPENDRNGRATRRKRNAEAMAARRTTDEAYRMQEQIANTNRMRLARNDLNYRVQEQIANTNQRRLAHDIPDYKMNERITTENN